MRNKNRFWRKYLAGFAIGGLVVSGLALGGSFSSEGESPLITEASAGVAGGGSGGGGGSSGTSGGRWLEIPKAKLDNGSIRNIPSEYWNDPVCRNAVRFFGVVPNGVTSGNATAGPWTYSFQGAAGLNSVTFGGGDVVASAIASNVNSTYQWAANYMRGKNFICLDNPNVLTASEWRYEVRGTSASDAINENEVHSYNTQVAPQSIRVSDGAYSPDPLNGGLNGQVSTTQTNYGRVWEEYKRAVEAAGADTQNIVASFKSRFAQAKAMDRAAAKAQVALNEGNLAGLSKGGILNINEFERRTVANVSTTSSNYQVWRCGYVRYSISGWQPSSANNCGIVTGSIDPDNLPTAGLGYARWDSAAERAEYTPVSPGQTSWQRFASVIRPSTETQRQVGFWQIISAHCNPQDIAALKSAMGDDLFDLDAENDPNRNGSDVSGLLRTKLYASQPSILPLGDERADTAAQQATGFVGFYNKECPFECTPAKNGNGATFANGAVKNVGEPRDDAPKERGLWGVVSSDGINSNQFDFFRDNSEKEIRPDVWYPVSGANGVSYDGSPAKTTMVTRWTGGTPSLGTEFNAYGLVKGADGKLTKTGPLFVTDGKQEPQLNFDSVKPFASSTGGQVAGYLEKIIVQSTWASTNGKPQSLQIAWEYSPQVTSRVPSSLGFTAGGTNVELGGFVNRVNAVDGHCWGEFGTDSQATRPLSKTILKANTGSGTTPQFSTPNSNGDNARNMLINFIRGTGE